MKKNSKFIKEFFYEDSEKYNEKKKEPKWKSGLISSELVNVQPLQAPIGQIFYVDYVYENNNAIQYTTYLEENLDTNVQYSQYVTENLDRSINYTEYIAGWDAIAFRN